jgi:hypothetical protein
MPAQQHRLPDEIRQAIIQLKAEYAPLSPHEIAAICSARFGRRPSPHTVKRILAEEPLPVGVSRRFPPYHAIGEAAERRLAVIRLHTEGWTTTSIAGYLGIDRRTVSRTLQRWIDEGVLGLDDTSRARMGGVRKVDLRAMLAVRELQENPELGGSASMLRSSSWASSSVHAPVGASWRSTAASTVSVIPHALRESRSRCPFGPSAVTSTGPSTFAISTTTSMTSGSPASRFWRITAGRFSRVASHPGRI